MRTGSRVRRADALLNEFAAGRQRRRSAARSRRPAGGTGVGTRRHSETYHRYLVLIVSSVSRKNFGRCVKPITVASVGGPLSSPCPDKIFVGNNDGEVVMYSHTCKTNA